MQFRNTPAGYGAIAQFFHWSTVLLVGIAWLLGEFQDAFPRGDARGAALFFHISAGLAVLCVLAARLFWRMADPPPPAETGSLKWIELLARFAHYALYALLLAAPVLGILVQFKRGNSLPIFGLTEIASPFLADRPAARNLKNLHELLSNMMIVLAGVHAAAALVHHWVLRDGTLTRMLPASLRKS